MSENEVAQWLPEARNRYIDDLVTSGASEEAARRKAQADTQQLFPGDQPSPDQFVFVIEADGEPVGELWLAERVTELGPCLWIYDIRVDDAHRGHGYGRAAMLFAEAEARERGYTLMGLNVFGGNEVARNLYRSLGYVEHAIFMSKAVGA